MFGKNKILYVVVILFFGCSVLFYFKLSRQMKSVVHYTKRSYHFLSSSPSQQAQFVGDHEKAKTRAKGSVELCHRLKKIPFGEDTGVVTGVTKIELNEVKAPYNASLIEDKDGYLLFFRYDVKEKVKFGNQNFPFKSFIGVAGLDKKFKQIRPISTIDTRSQFSEDPRIIKLGDDFFLSYNDLANNSIYSRTIRMARLTDEFKVKYILDLDQHIQPIEKNWVPFVYPSENEGSQIFFGYSINPHKIMKMKDPTKNTLEHELFTNEVCFQNLPWFHAWGVLRGGTPARLVDGKYLAFFHSSFKEDGNIWYVMAAYTFEAKPPFRVDAISEYPILFKGIYDSPPQNTAHSKLRCIFPAGFALDTVDGKEVIHVSCGENDCAVKIVTLDKEQLLKSLKPIPLTSQNNALTCDCK
jgi:predicted GH43/DUF377 family glycosyl hydrolase